MNWRNHLIAHWRSALAGGVACSCVGLVLLWFDGWPVFLSYDLLFRFHQQPPPQDLVIIYLDNRSFTELGQRHLVNWDRNLHARLLNRLTEDQCKLVVFDIMFSEPSTPEADANFAKAIARNGHVVLATALDYQSRPQVKASGPIPLLPELEKAATSWGLASLEIGPGGIVRRYFDGAELGPILPRTAAALMGKPAMALSNRESGGFLNYYGPALTLNNISYAEALDQPAGYFREKVVFIGAHPTTLKAQDEVDEFRTPHALWTHQLTPGVEIGATAFLNLVNGNGLFRWSGGTESLFVLVAGLLIGGLLGPARPVISAGAAVLLVVTLLLLAHQALRKDRWFPWTVVALGQVPVALAWSLQSQYQRVRIEKQVLERTFEETSRLAGTVASRSKESEPAIPDHSLVRRVGRGAYGEVWLARNAIGVFHAVKIIRRLSFPSDTPFEREFKGIQKFMPISRSHPGFVNILHVGRNAAAGYFFYIMEAADDLDTGPPIDPVRYSPFTLAAALQRHGRVKPGECIRLGLALSDALEHLHRQQLVHRDIKPGNIIFVNGAPKFADIGLVTERRTDAQDFSLVGTEGYVPPEGPGTPAADVYALGKVLYEACMGRDRQLFPEVPTAVWEEPDDSPMRKLNVVIGKACATNFGERYGSAAELHAALAGLGRE